MVISISVSAKCSKILPKIWFMRNKYLILQALANTHYMLN